jgi:hypothetical protein
LGYGREGIGNDTETLAAKNERQIWAAANLGELDISRRIRLQSEVNILNLTEIEFYGDSVWPNSSKRFSFMSNSFPTFHSRNTVEAFWWFWLENDRERPKRPVRFGISRDFTQMYLSSPGPDFRRSGAALWRGPCIISCISSLEACGLERELHRMPQKLFL